MIVSEGKIKPSKIKFIKSTHEAFYSTLKNRIGNDFKQRGLSIHANRVMVGKSILITAAYIITYMLIMSNFFGFLGVLFLFILMGIIIPLMGFNLTHDALHGSYSSNPLINRILGYTFDVNGTSSLVWKISHNIYHHTYTNIPKHDQDIEKAILLRFSPEDRLYWFHKYQHIYAPFLYSILTLVWYFITDYTTFFSEAKKRKIKTSEYIAFFGFKVVNILLLLVLPIIHLHFPWWQTLIGYVSMHLIGGVIIALVFQLAHIVEGVEFISPDSNGLMKDNWATHEMKTTSNFATNNRLLSYLVGGLNFQVEHHLFPNICHVHYPHISRIVRETAEEFNVPYHEHQTFFGAIRSHFRTLKAFGTGNL